MKQHKKSIAIEPLDPALSIRFIKKESFKFHLNIRWCFHSKRRLIAKGSAYHSSTPGTTSKPGLCWVLYEKKYFKYILD